MVNVYIHQLLDYFTLHSIGSVVSDKLSCGNSYMKQDKRRGMGVGKLGFID